MSSAAQNWLKISVNGFVKYCEPSVCASDILTLGAHCSWTNCTFIIVIIQLDKLYDPEAEEDDQLERYEEMNRMREHVMTEIDKNKDRMVSLEEFIESTNRASFDDDEPWEVCGHQAHHNFLEILIF